MRRTGPIGPSGCVEHLINIAPVNLKATRAFEAWKEADAAARLAENELEQAWKRYFLRESPAPIEELMREVGRRRKRADELLAAAIKALEAEQRSIDDTFTPGWGRVYRPPGKPQPDPGSRA